MKEIKRKTHILDAQKTSVGRLAVEVANLLRGKNKPDFAPHKDSGDIVVIKNAQHLKLTGNKFKTKLYRQASGYPGGLKEETAENVYKKNPELIIKKAVSGMLPKNKLRAIQIKRLKFEN